MDKEIGPWIHSGSTWALCRADPFRIGKTIVNYVRWSESAEQYVDMKGSDLAADLELAKRKIEEQQ